MSKQPSSRPATSPDPQAQSRLKKEAAALRANLARRKQAQRGKTDGPDEEGNS